MIWKGIRGEFASWRSRFTGGASLFETSSLRCSFGNAPSYRCSVPRNLWDVLGVCGKADLNRGVPLIAFCSDKFRRSMERRLGPNRASQARTIFEEERNQSKHLWYIGLYAPFRRSSKILFQHCNNIPWCCNSNFLMVCEGLFGVQCRMQFQNSPKTAMPVKVSANINKQSSFELGTHSCWSCTNQKLLRFASWYP